MYKKTLSCESFCFFQNLMFPFCCNFYYWETLKKKRNIIMKIFFSTKYKKYIFLYNFFSFIISRFTIPTQLKTKKRNHFATFKLRLSFVLNAKK